MADAAQTIVDFDRMGIELVAIAEGFDVKRGRGERISRHAPYGWDFGPDSVLVENALEQKGLAWIQVARSGQVAACERGDAQYQGRRAEAGEAVAAQHGTADRLSVCLSGQELIGKLRFLTDSAGTGLIGPVKP